MAEDEPNGIPPDLAKELQKEAALREQQSREMYLSDFDKFKQGLRLLDVAKTEEEKDEATVEIYSHYEEMRKQEMGHLDFIAEKHMKAEFTFPYDSRSGAVWFMSMRREIEDTLALDPEKGGFEDDSQARKWLETLHDAVVWGDANFAIQEGLNMIQWHYGALDAMASGLPNMKEKITATTLQEAFARDLRGDGSTRAANEGLEVRRGKVEGSKKVMAQVQEGFVTRRDGRVVPNLVNKEIDAPVRNREQIENIRELGVDYQDEFFYWRTLVANAAQYDYTGRTQETLVDKSRFREGLELKFIVELFAVRNQSGNIETVDFNGHNVPKEILNQFTMRDTKKNRTLYRQTMEALMQVDAREELEKLESQNPDGTLNINMAALQILINKVDAARKEIARREKARKMTIQDRIGSMVVKLGLTFDLGSGNAGPEGWQWKYTKDRRGNILRQVDFGGIDQMAGDWYTPEFPVFHNDTYDKKVSKRSALILPTPDKYRKSMVVEKSPMDKPLYSFEEAQKLGLDSWTLDEVLKIIAPDDQEITVQDTNGNEIKMLAGEWRAKNRFRIDPDVRKALEKMLWFQEVPFAGKDGKNQLFATFIPHRFKIGFLDQALIENGKTYVSLADKLRNGGKLSEMDWENGIKEHQWNWWLVNINMAERWARFLAEPGDPRRQEELMNGIGTYKEFLKRAILGSRGWFVEIQVVENGITINKAVPAAVIILAVVGQMNMLAAAKQNERGGGLTSDLIGEAIETSAQQDAWEKIMKEHIFMAEYMAPDLDESEKNPEFFNETLALIEAVTGNNLYKIALEGGSNEAHDKLKADAAMRTMLVRRDRLVKRNLGNFKRP